MERKLPLLLICFFLLTAQHQQVFAQKKKNNSDILLQQIKTEMDVRRNYAKALSMAKDAVKDYPDNADFRFLLGRLYYLNNDMPNAEKRLDEVIKDAPGYQDAYLTAANIQLARNNIPRAMQYLNKGQARFGRDRYIRYKKLAIYQSTRNFREGNLYADSLINIFSRDTGALRVFIDYRNETGNHYLKQGLTNMADKEFGKVLEVSPRNKEAQEGMFSARMQSGDKQNGLNFVNSMLTRQPDSYELLMKKTGILQDMRQYPEAIETLQYLIKKYPGDAKARQMETELKLEAARYYRSTDPYFQYQSVLERSPGNKEALDNVINIAISRGMQDEALFWINKAMPKNTFNKELMTKKMSILEQQRKYTAAAAIAERLYRNAPGNRDTRESFINLELAAARDYAAQQLPDSALEAYSKILEADPREEQALNSSVNILSGQKNYTAALELLDKAIGYYPDDQGLKLKKAAIMQDNEQYDEAARLFDEIQSANPGDRRARNSMTDAYLLTGRQMMQVMDYDGAATAFNRILAVDPRNKEAINSITNIDLALGGAGNERALNRIEDALTYYPDDKELLLKKSEALSRLNRNEEAVLITDALRNKYPYNTKVRDIYIEQNLTAAAHYRATGDTVNVENSYFKVLSANVKDTTAWLGLHNISFEKADYTTALQYADTALGYYPANTTFMLKRASALEQLKQYQAASLAADTVARMHPDQRRYTDFAAYLKGKTFRHQLGFAYLNSHIDSAQSANIATLQYTYLGKKATFTARLNFAGRATGTGLQLELESYVYHSSSTYSLLSIAGANELVFPRVKASYSLFHNFSHGWEAELGGRYLNFDSLSSISAVASLAKYLGDFWINVKGYGIFISGKQYGAVNVTARQYLNNKTDFFYATVGYGNSPDDFTRVFQFSEIVSFQTYSIGAGYQKMFNYRNVVSLNGTWYNQKRDEGRFRNQYDIYLTFLRKF